MFDWFTCAYLLWTGFYFGGMLLQYSLGMSRRGLIYKRNCSSMRRWLADTLVLGLFLWGLVSNLRMISQKDELDLLVKQVEQSDSKPAEILIYVYDDDSELRGLEMPDIRGVYNEIGTKDDLQGPIIEVK